MITNRPLSLAFLCFVTSGAGAAIEAREGQEGQDTPTVEPEPSVAVVETLAADLECGTGGLEVDAKGFVYCSDFGSKLGAGGIGGNQVLRIDPKTGASEVFVDGLRGASGNAIGPGGDFFQSNIGGNSISRVTPDGKATVFLSQGLNSPVGIAIDEEGMLFVANCGSNSIVEVMPEGESALYAKDALLKCPNGIVLDDEHNLYVANFGNGDVIKISWSGEVSRLATLPGNNNGHLVYREGSLYVVARGAHQIFKVSLDGEVELFAGSGKRGRDDGPALEATFSFPNDMAFSPDGKLLYVNESSSITDPGTELRPTTVRRIRLAD
jgi:sugar lactone lactonase YvrE